MLTRNALLRVAYAADVRQLETKKPRWREIELTPYTFAYQLVSALKCNLKCGGVHTIEAHRNPCDPSIITHYTI